MAMQMFCLSKKKHLTHNVFELTFESENELNFQAGQFITFLLDGVGGRAYSIAKASQKSITLIIKKWEIREGGRGGSVKICDLAE